MRDSTQFHLNDADTDLRLVWSAFDGDDCFNDFHIDVSSQSGTQRFTFGPCVVHGLRKMNRFFRDDRQASVSLGFRHPDIRYCDLVRSNGDYRLLVRFAGGALSHEYFVRKPALHLDDEFLAAY